MEQDYSDLPTYLTSGRGEAAQANFSVQDYGREGDQRPYQIVQPTYPAPKFMQTYSNLNQALRECDTFCKLSGHPMRLVKWGARRPCMPCKKHILTSNRLPSLKLRPVYSPGALEGFPDATPLADMSPDGTRIVYGPDGAPQVVGAPNYTVSYDAQPASVGGSDAALLTYEQAVKSAQYLANMLGQQAYICAGFGSSCKGRNPKKWVPMVYVEPGGLVRRYADDFPLGNARSARGSTTLITPVNPDEYQELVRQSEGGTFLSQND